MSRYMAAHYLFKYIPSGSHQDVFLGIDVFGIFIRRPLNDFFITIVSEPNIV